VIGFGGSASDISMLYFLLNGVGAIALDHTKLSTVARVFPFISSS